ncbi:hypothetical protein [Amycolatopsis albispora]|uniref:hypothetical protein n=1 Tax=Amycolatopsis albispora TaxID=1804986 RepID=UPI0013B41665|nr:hypothetical protein [Amycolatopsis albispora]
MPEPVPLALVTPDFFSDDDSFLRAEPLSCLPESDFLDKPAPGPERGPFAEEPVPLALVTPDFFSDLPSFLLAVGAGAVLRWGAAGVFLSLDLPTPAILAGAPLSAAAAWALAVPSRLKTMARKPPDAV